MKRSFTRRNIPTVLLSLRDSGVTQFLTKPGLERAIGVIYRPETERVSHYFHSQMARQLML